MSIDIHALSGAYAVDAVDEFERAQFERHLAGCAACRAEVDSLREASSLIGETSAVTPPDSLRASVLAGIQTVRPMPPVLVAASERGRSTRRRFPALVAAAAALIVVGGLGATAWHPWSDDQPPAATEAQRVQDAPDAKVFEGELSNGGAVKVVRSASLNQAVVTTTGLTELDEDFTYELWLIHDGEMVPAGFTDGDVSSLLLEGDPATASGAGITIEPAGGSKTPSLPPVAQVDFEQA